MTGYLDHPRVLEAMSLAAIVVVPSRWNEPFGLTALESQACATPVVGIRGSYMDRIILGSQEHWARENSVLALAEAVAAAAAMNLRRSSLAVAESVREHYAWPVVFKKLFRLYDEVRTRYCAE